jgi:hypothetical protein
MRALRTIAIRSALGRYTEQLFCSGKYESQVVRMRFRGLEVQIARRFEFAQSLRRSASSLRIFVRSNGIVRPQTALSIKIPKRSGIRLGLPIYTRCTLSNVQDLEAETRFRKIRLDKNFCECYLSKYS